VDKAQGGAVPVRGAGRTVDKKGVPGTRPAHPINSTGRFAPGTQLTRPENKAKVLNVSLRQKRIASLADENLVAELLRQHPLR